MTSFVSLMLYIYIKHEYTNTCQPLKCAACILDKMERVPTSTTQFPSCQSGKLRRDDILLGNGAAMDQFVVYVKGRTWKNISNDSAKYNGGLIYVNHSSQCIFNHNQVSLHSRETLIGKRILEHGADASGFKLIFSANNGVYTSVTT